MGEEKPVTMATKYCTIVVMYIMYQFFSDEILTITGHFDLMRLGMEVIAECYPGRLSLIPRPLCYGAILLLTERIYRDSHQLQTYLFP